MKYIRTKDGIIPDKDKYLKDLDIEQYSMYMQGLLKEADTIEGLCDEFVGVDIETKTGCIANSYSELAKVKKEMNKYDFQLGKDYEVYGAIWTNKGLIYVAKMNESGVLELL